MKRLTLCSLLALSSLFANPQGMVPVAGDIAAQQSAGKMTIIAGDKAIIHWDQFSIDTHELTQFILPKSSSAVLNRVTGSDISSIQGSLLANGQVFLINPNGILIGKEASIDAASFIASTLNILNEDFLHANEWNFFGEGDAKLIHLGKIHARDGDAILMSYNIECEGDISAPNGLAALVSGSEVLIKPKDGILIKAKRGKEIQFSGNIDAKDTHIETGSNLYSLGINHSGTIKSHSVKQSGGRVYLVASGAKNEVSGTVIADKHIEVLGDEIQIQPDALIDVSSTSGGEILIGGDYQGENPTVENATRTTVEQGAQIRADGLLGDGGKIIVWADDTAIFHGSISARGYNGGFAEVSGKEHVALTGHADLRPLGGAYGTFLCDGPVLIQDGTNTPPPVTMDVFNDAYVAAQLGLGNFSILTANSTAVGDNTITINGTVNITWSAATTLTLTAGRNISMNSGAVISNTHAGPGAFTAVSMAANSGGGATGDFDGITINGSITTSFGNISLDGTGGTTGTDNRGILTSSTSTISTLSSGTITMVGDGGGNGTRYDGIQLSGGNISAVDGLISLTGSGTGFNRNFGIQTASSVSITSTGSGGITMLGTAATADNNSTGISIESSSSISSTSSGNISITGIGGTGASAFNNDHRGVVVSASTISSTGTGTITINGTGGDAFVRNDGIRITGASTISSITGNIDLTGVGDAINTAGDFNIGINIFSSTILSTGAANITLHGTGADADSTNYGVSIDGNGATCNGVSSTICASPTSTGNISVTGIGGTGQSVNNVNNRGILMTTDARINQAGTGTMTIAGTGGFARTGSDGIEMNSGHFLTSTGNMSVTGDSNGGRDQNHGIQMLSGSTITTTGSGTITLDGDGADATNDNIGVVVSGTGSLVTSSGSGAISITGDGGMSGGNSNKGIILSSGGKVTSTSTSTITLTGTGGATQTSDADGVEITGTDSGVSSVTGNIQITGMGTGSTTGNTGIHMSSAGAVTSSGAAMITMNGTGSGSSTQNCGIGISDASTTISSAGGNISLTGASSGTGMDAILLNTNATVTGAGASSISMTSTNTDIRILGTLTTANGSLTFTAPGTGSIISNISLATNNQPITVNGAFETLSNLTVNSGAGAGNVSFSSTIDGANTFEVTAGTGTATFTGAVGGTSPLTTFSASASLINVGNNITTNNGTHTYTGPVMLTGNSILSSGAGAGNIGFSSTINGAQTLSVTAGTGTVTFPSAVGGAAELTSFAASGSQINVAANMTTNNGEQTYSGPVALSSGLTMSSGAGAGNIAFTTTVDGAVAFIVNAGTGTVSYSGAVGGATPLTSIASTGSQINLGADVTTNAGMQTYTGPVVLTGASTVSSGVGVGNILFTSTLDGTQVFVANAGTGTVTFTGAIGSTPLSSFAATGSQINVGGDVRTNAGAQTYTGPVVLTGNSSMSNSSGATNINFTSTLNGAQTFSVNAGTGMVTFPSAVGGVTPLSSFSATGSQVNVGGNVTTNNGTISFASPVVLTGPVAVFSGVGIGNINFTSTIDGSEAFIVNAGTGAINFSGEIGGITPLSSIAATSSQTLVVNNVTTNNGDQTFTGPVIITGAGPTFFSGVGAGNIRFTSTIVGVRPLVVNAGTGTVTFDSTLGTGTPIRSLVATGSQINVGGDITTVNDVQTFTGPVVLTGNAALSSGSGAGNIFFSSTLDGNRMFSASSGTGTVIFSGDVGATTPLSTISISGAGCIVPTIINAQGGTALFSSPVTLVADTTITDTGGTGITFLSTITGNYNLVIDSPSSAITAMGAVDTSGDVVGDDGGSVTATASGDIYFASIDTRGGAESAGAGPNGGDVMMTSSGGSIRIGFANTSGTDATITGGDAGDIFLQPDSGFSTGTLAPGSITPNGTLCIDDALTANGGTAPTPGTGGTISLSPTGRTAGNILSVATIFGLTTGSNLTIEGENLVVGPFETITIFGDVNINMASNATIGDVVARDNLTISAGNPIIVNTHGIAQILDAFGMFDQSPKTSFISRETAPTISATVNPASDYDLYQETRFSQSLFGQLLTYMGSPLNYTREFNLIGAVELLCVPTTANTIISEMLFQLRFIDFEKNIWTKGFSITDAMKKKKKEYRYFLPPTTSKLGRR